MKSKTTVILGLVALAAIGGLLVRQAFRAQAEIARAEAVKGRGHEAPPEIRAPRDTLSEPVASSASEVTAPSERASVEGESAAPPQSMTAEVEAAVLSELWDFQPGWNGQTTDYGLQEQSSVYQPRGFRPVPLEQLGLDSPPESRAQAYSILVQRVLPSAELAASMIGGLALTTIFDRELRRTDVSPEDRAAAESIISEMRDATAPLLAELETIIQLEYDAQLRGTAVKLFRRGEMPPDVVRASRYALRDYVAVGDWYCALEFDPLLNPSAAQILSRIDDARSKRDAALAAILR